MHPSATTGSPDSRNQRLVPHGQRRRHLDARHVGVPLVRVVGPRVPHGRAGDGRHRLRQGPARTDAARAATCTRTDSCRRTSGTSATSTRRCTPGRHASCTRLEIEQTRRGRRRLAGERVPQAGGQLHLVGQPQGSRPGATCSRAASSASTTSACSTAARRCPPAATSSKPTARRGWRSTRSACSAIALELSRRTTRLYEDMALKFVEHFLFIAAAMDRIGDNDDELWDEEDGFFYDVLRLPDGTAGRLKVRSLVGLLPLCAATVLPTELRAAQRGAGRPAAPASSWPTPGAAGHDPRRPPSAGASGRRMLAVLDETKLRRVLATDARRGRVPQPARASARCRAYHARPARTRCDVDGQSYERRTTCRPNRTPACSAATRTGGARCGSRSTSCVLRSPAAPVRVLRRRVHRGVPDRVGQPVHAVRGGGGDRSTG